MTPAPKNDGNSGFGCAILIVAVLAIGTAAYFALVENAEFIGAKTIRTLAGEAEEAYEYTKRTYQETFGNRVANAPILMPAAPTAPNGTHERTADPSTGFRDTAVERNEVPNPAMRHLN